MSFRLPGTTQALFWDDLLAGRDLVTQVDPTRWASSVYFHPNKAHPGSAYTFAAGSIGDAAGFVDPITGEGIYFALRSAQILAATLRETASPLGYPERVLEDFGRDLLKGASLRRRFYAPGFARRLVRYSARSASLERVLGDLVLGEQPYLSLKARLLRTLPSFALESLLPRRRRSSGEASSSGPRTRAAGPSVPARR